MLQKFPLYRLLPRAGRRPRAPLLRGQAGLRSSQQEIAGGVVYEFAGGTRGFLYPTPNAGTSQASQAFWQVDDVDAEIAELKSRGVVFEHYDDMPGERSPSGAITAGGAKAAWFKDSEGNILAIIQAVRP